MKDYIINTFASQREKNVNNAIKFYREKTDALLNSMDVEAKHKLLNTINNIDSISQILEEKILTSENKKKTKKGLKIAGIITAVILAVDVISMIIYFLLYGIPK